MMWCHWSIDKDDRYGCGVFDHAAAAAAGIAGIVGPAQASIVICNCFSISAVSKPAVSVAAVLSFTLLCAQVCQQLTAAVIAIVKNALLVTCGVLQYHCMQQQTVQYYIVVVDVPVE